jgi:ABC-type bacteriocin/lantibiotic exporter with double-glycine peptidase domain
MNEQLLETKSDDNRHRLRRIGVFFGIFSSIANVGNERPLVAEDVPAFHTSSQSQKSLQKIIETAGRRTCCPSSDSISDSARFYSARKMFLFLLSHRWLSYLYLNILKLLSCALSFISPVLLGKFVEYFDDEEADLYRGILLLVVLFVSQLLSTILSSQFNIQATMMETELKGAFYLGVFKLSLAFRIHESMSRGLTNGQIMNVLQIDVDRSIETLKSFIDLWSIPLQVVIAFLLLYYQVNIAFVAGVAAIVLMIPLNSFIARRIGIATSQVVFVFKNVCPHKFPLLFLQKIISLSNS